jgi:metallo-beta-lactamase family protein
MKAKLRFLGAAQNVTGSRFLLETENTKLLVDCGLYQERQLRARNWEPFPVQPASIDAVLLTHAHLDHCGLLPKLVSEGFNGPIFCTPATSEIAQIVLADSGHLQEEDAEYKRKRHEKEGRKGAYPELPLYTADDAKACTPLFQTFRYGRTIQLDGGLEATFYDAGHILGSSMIKVKFPVNGEHRTVLFSGDIGRPGRPIVRDPTVFEEADYVLLESTYGDREHQPTEDVEDAIGDVINSTEQAGGNIIVPSFAIERSQEILYYVNALLRANKIPHIPIILDSPMATNVTEVFKNHPELYDDQMAKLVRDKNSPFNFPDLKITRTTEESKAINFIKETIMVIAGSGMCTGGRIKHHLVNNISQPENTIMFVGYQAVGTLGRSIVDGIKEVRILGQKRKVEARVTQIHGFSSHADRAEILKWLTEFNKAPRALFLVHGEPESARNFSDYITEKTGWKNYVPAYRDEFILE